MTASSSFSLIFLLFLSLVSTAFTFMNGVKDHSLIQQVVSSDVQDDLLMYAEHHFSAFKKAYNKTYLTQEEDDYRFGVFMSNFRQARRNQVADPAAVHGVTVFSDLTPSEFRRKYLRLDSQIQLSKHLKTAPLLPTNNLPTTYDWREYGAVTPVKHQGQCAACWAFASTATLETAHFVANSKLLDLSEQQLIDCSDECTADQRICNRGCSMGNYILAYRYMLKVGGVEETKDYPYTGIDTGSCKFDKKKIAASIYEFETIVADEDQYAANLVEYGTVAVEINGDMMQSYVSGVACPSCTGALNHAVTLVGYGSDRHWIIKNSFGINFGENGYYRLCKGRLTCGVNPVAAFPFAS